MGNAGLTSSTVVTTAASGDEGLVVFVDVFSTSVGLCLRLTTDCKRDLVYCETVSLSLEIASFGFGTQDLMGPAHTRM